MNHSPSLWRSCVGQMVREQENAFVESGERERWKRCTWMKEEMHVQGAKRWTRCTTATLTTKPTTNKEAVLSFDSPRDKRIDERRI